LPVVGAHDQAADVVHAFEEGAGGDGEVGAAGLDTARVGLGVRGLDGLGDLVETDLVAGQAFRLDIHRHLLTATTDDEGIGGVLDLLQGLEHVLGQEAQLAVIDIRQPVAIGILGPEGQGDDGHVIDTLALDQGGHDPGGDLVHDSRRSCR
jgi:hypothetical protein